MKRTATVTVLGIILVGAIASIAAINAGPSSVVPDLKGKSVIIGLSYPPIENLELRVIGKREFYVVPIKRDDGSSYDHWKALESVSSLDVYDSMEEATKVYNQRAARRNISPYRATEGVKK